MDIEKIKEFVWRHKIVSSVILLLILIIIFSVYGVTQNSFYGVVSSPSYAPMMSREGGGPFSPMQKSDVVGNSQSLNKVSQTVDSAALGIPRKIINSGSLGIYVKDTNKAISDIKQIAANNGGYIDSSRFSENNDGVRNGNIVIRVSDDKFEKAFDEIKGVAEKVKTESVGAEDVTSQYIDLQANLKNLQATEEQYRQIMKSAVKIEDILNVQDRLSQVRGQIEQIQGQLQYLERQVSMSIISINITSEPDVEIFGIVWKPLTTLKLGLKGFLLDMKQIYESAVSFTFKLPGLMLRLAFWLVIIWAGVKVLRWAYNIIFPRKTIPQ